MTNLTRHEFEDLVRDTTPVCFQAPGWQASLTPELV